MSLLREIPLVLEQHGPQSAKTLAPHFPKHSHAQIVIGLQNARCQKLVHLVGQEPSQNRGNRPGIYAAGPKPEPEPLPRVPLSIHPLHAAWGPL